MAKTFILSDESINDKGTRVLTSGIDLERFKKNPVMLWMHRRDNGWDYESVRPIGIWENIRKEDEKLMADAKFDENDKFASLIQSKVDSGFIRGCSIGIRPMTFSDDPKHLEKGQTRATITKCEIYEASIVDMPSNKNTVSLFSSTEDNEVPLLKNSTEMADKKDEKQTLTFGSEEEMFAFMKDKFGIEPKAKEPKGEPEPKAFSFETEEAAGNWFQKMFGLKPKSKTEKEEPTEEKLSVEETEEYKTLAAEKAKLEEQVEKLKNGDGAESPKSTQTTDEGGSGDAEERLSSEDIEMFNALNQ